MQSTSPLVSFSKLKDHYDVIIIGAGAAGLMCALTAAKRQRRVLVIEKANKVGKKILMSGGGRCNFSNYSIEADNFISHNSHFCKSALSQYTQWDFIALVDSYGIEYEERKHGQLFCKNSARDILDMLLAECLLGQVDIVSHSLVTAVEPSSAISEDTHPLKATDRHLKKYRIKLDGSAAKPVSGHRTISGDSLVIATGALSIPTLGGSGYGYELANQFALPLTDKRAGLVPLMFSDAMKTVCESLSGLSLEVSIRCNNTIFTESLLFTHRGISGPAVLQISSYWQAGDEISIDLLPSTDALQWLKQAKLDNGKQQLATVLRQKLPKALTQALLSLWQAELGHTGGRSGTTELSQLSEQKLSTISASILAAIAQRLQQWVLKPSGSEGYRTAEVTLGGVSTDAISSKTMQVKQQPGLYFIGEVLDVTGHLGGYNFQWAWSSGYCAGCHV